MNKKKLIFISLAILVVISIGYLLTRKSSEPGQTVKKPAFTPFPAKIFTNTKPLSRVRVLASKEAFPKNTELSIIVKKPSPPFTENQAKTWAANLGFSGDVITTKDAIRGSVYLWSSDQAYLNVYTDSKIIEYALLDYNTSRVASPAANEEIIRVAKDFLVRNKFVTENQLALPNITFFGVSGSDSDKLSIVTKQAATIYQVNFSSTVDGVTLIPLDPINAPIYVWVLPNGTIAKAYISDLGTLTQTNERYPLKTYEEVVSQAASATIISLDDGFTSPETTSVENLGEITVEEISIAYLIDSQQAISYQPVYILKGKTVIKNTSGEVSVIMYLPAFVSNN